MPDGEIRKVKVHYRLAVLEGGQPNAPNLQTRLDAMMKSAVGDDTRERILPMADDDQHKGCLNFTRSEQAFFVGDVMHLDGRTSLPTWVHPKEPKPYAEIIPRDLAEGEASLGEPAYLMVVGNHVAVIERMGFRNTNLSHYLNELLQKAGQIDGDSYWKLVPKIEAEGNAWQGGGVKKVVVKPKAAFVGEAPPAGPADDQVRRRAKKAAQAFEDLIARGQQVIDALAAFGADETKIETLREAMSQDLIIKAKLELSVAHVRRRSTAEVAPDTIQQALAELAMDGQVVIQSEDGRSNGRLIQLVHNAEVLEKGGLLDWGRTIDALSAALHAWAAKGAIELA